MRNDALKIDFDNKENPKSYFDIVLIEDLFKKNLNHDISINHIVKFYIIFFVNDGTGYHTIDFTDYNYRKGIVLLIRKNQVHKFFKSPNIKGHLLIFTEDFIISHLNRMEALNSMQLFNESLSYPKLDLGTGDEYEEFNMLLKHLKDEYNVRDDYSTGITRSILHVMITKLFRIKSKQGQLLKRQKYLFQFLDFQTLVENQCLNTRKVQYYAQELAISTKTLNNIVNQVVNSSAKRFIDDKVILQIKRKLISTDHSIKEIAFQAGFSDSTNFYKYFKKFVGSSPEVFRRAHQ